eukprot:3430719-Rhodomonas_salina.1
MSSPLRILSLCLVISCVCAVPMMHSPPSPSSSSYHQLKNPNCSGTEECPVWPTQFSSVRSVRLCCDGWAIHVLWLIALFSMPVSDGAVTTYVDLRLWQPFGLYSIFPKITNASSMFYSKYTDTV